MELINFRDLLVDVLDKTKAFLVPKQRENFKAQKAKKVHTRNNHISVSSSLVRRKAVCIQN
jgi:hypothetical protein